MTSAIPERLSTQLTESGWRTEMVVQPDGTTVEIKVPLTDLEFLHPQEGYHLPNSTFHDNITADAKDMLTRRYMNDFNTAVFSDLIIKWDIPDLGNYCPDVCVVVGVRNKEQNRTDFVVAEEGVRPSFIIEVVSPRYRKVDREIKVKEYAQAGVQEYVIIDQRRQRGQVIEEVIGYRLVEGSYLPITPDEEGQIFCETVGLRISLNQGQVMMEDAATGESLLTSRQLEQRLNEVEQRAARMAERLRAAGIDPNEI